MNRIFAWMMAAILSCSTAVFASCVSADNPVDKPSQDEKNADRAAIEKVLSERLAETAQDARLESALRYTRSLSEFLSTLDENAIKVDLGTFVATVVSKGKPVEMSSLSAQDKQAVEKCMKDQFKMSNYDLSNLESFVQIDAHETLNKFHLTLENDKCTFTEDAEKFTVEIVKSATGRIKFQADFGSGNDDICIFLTRVGDAVPLALQVPKSFNVSLTTPKGHVMNSVINLSSTATSSYVSIPGDDWKVGAVLTATVNGRYNTIAAHLSNSKSSKYTDDYINSDEFTQLREMGTFFSAAYEGMRFVKSKTIQEFSVTLDDDFVISGSVDDIAKSMLALSHLSQLHGTNPGFYAVDTYTQELNKYVHFTFHQKSTNITAQGSLLTIMKGSKNEYQPGVALTFKGEAMPQCMYENLSEEDLANYNKIVQNLSELVNEGNTIIEKFSSKIKTIASAFKI